MTDITGGLITLEYATSGLQWNGVGQAGNTARDADIATYIQAATPVIEDIVGPVLAAPRTLRFDGDVASIVLPDNVTAITVVTENGVATTDYLFDAQRNIIYAGVTGLRGFAPGGRLNISITYTVGWAIIPPTIQLATRELVRFWYQQGMQSNRPAFGDPSMDVTYTPQGFAVPKRVMELCAPYRKLGGFA